MTTDAFRYTICVDYVTILYKEEITMKKIIFICIIIALLLCALFFCYLNKDKVLHDEKINEDSSEKYFTPKEQEIMTLIYNKLNILDYFDKDNLESFEITSFYNYGYFESKSNIRYIQVNYEFTCKDNTYNCNHLDSRIAYRDEYTSFFCFHIAIDLNDKDYIEIDPEFTIYFNSDWVSPGGRIE